LHGSPLEAVDNSVDHFNRLVTLKERTKIKPHKMSPEFLLTHPKYHTYKIGKEIIKGCDTVDDETSWNQDRKVFTQKFCLTHGVIVCRCGWERGHYMGTDSRGMMIKPPRSEYHKAYYQRRKKIKSNEDAITIVSPSP
jgi:hypothetical protein